MAPKRLPTEASSRDRVLESAIEEYATYGYAGARIDRIARRVRLNVRMIYYHFGSKEGLYRACLKEIYLRSAEMLERASGVEDPEKRSVEAIHMFFDLLHAHPRFADVLVRELLDGAHQLRALFAEDPQLFERVHKPSFMLLMNAITAGEFRPVPAPETVMVITNAILAIHATRGVHDLFLGGKKPSLEEWKVLFTDLVLNGLRPRP